MHSILVLVVLSTSLLGLADAGGFLGANRSKTIEPLSVEYVERSLIAELAGGLDERRPLAEVEKGLRPMYAALPKGAGGKLDRVAVRYALHRYFVQRHGWYVKGLDPAGSAWSNWSSDGVAKDRVPEYIQGFFERRAGHGGLGLRELVVFAATMEDLIHNEAVDRLRDVYDALQLPTVGRITPAQVDAAAAALMMVYIGGNVSNVSSEELALLRTEIHDAYPQWPETEMWTKDVVKSVEYNERHRRNPFVAENVDFDGALHVVEEITERFGSHQHDECRSLKDALVVKEYRGTGRVRLSDFWGTGMDEDSPFLESVDYLRALGVLDEANPQRPTVVIPNYINSHSNCVASGDFYSVCCRNECEILLASLERDVAAPSATAKRIADLVSALPSDTTDAPRNLSTVLLGRLADIAAHHSGRVPLHGRLFAQWMHHAYPRECPFPHVAGVTKPQSPDEWEDNTGRDALVTEEEVRYYANLYGKGGDEAETELLPWTAVEELVGAHDAEESLTLSLWRGLAAGGLLAALASLGATVAHAARGAGYGAPQHSKLEKLLV